MFKIIKKADVLLFVFLILTGLGLSWLSAAEGGDGKTVKITVDGQLYGTYSLAEDRTVEISRDGHINKITINDGTVQMSYSTCKNQVCVKDGAVSRTNQSIVCLPNRVVAEIEGGEEELDAVAK